MPVSKARANSNKPTDCLRLKPGCNLVASTVEAEREAWMKALGTGPKKVVLDLAGVNQIDSLGITLILGTYKSCQNQGVSFAVEEAAPDLVRVFKLFSIPKLFPVQEASSHE